MRGASINGAATGTLRVLRDYRVVLLDKAGALDLLRRLEPIS
jgi:hypothetical protein